MKSKKKIIFITLGFIDLYKNPIEFISHLNFLDHKKNNYKYYVIGNIEKKTYEILKEKSKQNDNIIIKQKFLSENEYKNYFNKADAIVIPNGKSYEYMSSGIMWDCFKYKKIFLAPNNQLSKFYLKKYKIGFIYKNKNLPFLFKKLKVLNKTKLKKEYTKLYRDFSFNKNLKTMEKILF